MVKSQVQFLTKVKAYFSSLTTLTEDEDRSTVYIGVPPLKCRTTCLKSL